MAFIPDSYYGANNAHYEFTEEEKERIKNLIIELKEILGAEGFSVEPELSATNPRIDWHIHLYKGINPNCSVWAWR